MNKVTSDKYHKKKICPFWLWCYYLHTLQDSVSPVWGIKKKKKKTYLLDWKILGNLELGKSKDDIKNVQQTLKPHNTGALSAVLCSAVQCSAVQLSAVKYTAVRYTLVLFSAVKGSAV